MQWDWVLIQRASPSMRNNNECNGLVCTQCTQWVYCNQRGVTIEGYSSLFFFCLLVSIWSVFTSVDMLFFLLTCFLLAWSHCFRCMGAWLHGLLILLWWYHCSHCLHCSHCWLLVAMVMLYCSCLFWWGDIGGSLVLIRAHDDFR